MRTFTNLEAITVHTAVWGDLGATIDAHEAGQLVPGLFHDRGHRATIAAIGVLINQGVAPLPERVQEALVVAGHDRAEAVDLVLVSGAFEAAGYRLDGLTHYLHRLAEEVERRRLNDRLVSLADQLHRPGGPQRVAAVLEGATA